MIDHIAFILRQAARACVGTIILWPVNSWMLGQFWRLAVTVAFAIP